SPAPALLQSAGGEDEDTSSAVAEDDCSGCAIIADVAGIVWYDEVFVTTVATAVVSVNNGNATAGGAGAARITRTSIIENARSTVNNAQFTFNPGAGVSAFGTFPIQAINVGYNSITTIAGATLTSPTAYNVFSAYTLTSSISSDGSCQLVTTSVDLPSAFTQTLPTGSGRVTLDLAGAQSFINELGFSSCRNDGQRQVGSVLAQVSEVTVRSTTSFSGIALAAQSTPLAPTTNPTTRAPLRTTTIEDVLTTLTATLSGSETITPDESSPTITSAPSFGMANAPAIVIGNRTITPEGNPFGLPIMSMGNVTLVDVDLPGANANATGVIIPGDNETIPFVGDAPGLRSGTALLGSLLFLSVMAVGWFL
ncbi:MAG: hypothetical protein Q9174_006434, partial [Haloplaca sp. 1 TL-2023]